MKTVSRTIQASILVLGAFSVVCPQIAWAANSKMMSHAHIVKAKPTVKLSQQHIAINRVLPGQVALNNSTAGRKISTSLAKNCVTGSHFPTVTLSMRKAGGDGSLAGKLPLTMSDHENDRLRHSGEVLKEMPSIHLGQRVVNTASLADIKVIKTTDVASPKLLSASPSSASTPYPLKLSQPIRNDQGGGGIVPLPPRSVSATAAEFPLLLGEIMLNMITTAL
jgi:type VI protein secretion system component Hcp